MEGWRSHFSNLFSKESSVFMRGFFRKCPISMASKSLGKTPHPVGKTREQRDVRHFVQFKSHEHMIVWLVVSNMTFIFHNIWDNPSHWLIFFRGVETTNQLCFSEMRSALETTQPSKNMQRLYLALLTAHNKMRGDWLNEFSVLGRCAHICNMYKIYMIVYEMYTYS